MSAARPPEGARPLFLEGEGEAASAASLGEVVQGTCFVTGATGAVGSALVPALLADRDAHVHLLIRARDGDELRRRVDGLFAFWQLGPDESDARARVSALAGDVTVPRFGLDESAYRSLAQTCTHVVHSAGAVRMNLPIEEARRSSVESARNVVALARACQANGQLRKVEFVSTVGVLGRRQGVLQEDWIAEPRGFHNTYEAAKAEAEDYLRGEVDAGLPVTVHRPSMVVGDSRTGRIAHYQVFYHLCDFLSGRRTRGVHPRLGRMRLDTIPADYVGAAIAWSSRQPTMAGRILHLCSGPQESIPLDRLKALVESMLRTRGVKVPRAVAVSPGTFRFLARLLELVVDDRTRRAMRTLPVFLDYLASDQGFANAKSVTTLAAAGIAWPAPDDYLPTVIGRYHAERSARTSEE